ncbi:MAG: toll/interleukin-1 receptor domain-containing protein [Pseudomonadota bacterium]
MADVFISYAREDAPKAKLLAEALLAEGLSVWWDHDLIGGDNFREQIAETIAAASCVIVIWSENSVASPFVKDEASRANDRQILLPVAIGETNPPVGFGELQTIRFKRWAETTAEWESLVRTVHARLRAVGVQHAAPASNMESTRRQLAFFGRNLDLFLLTMFAHGLACFLLFQPLHFLTAISLEAKLGFVVVLSLFVSGFQSWVLIAQRAGLVLRAVSFAAGILVGLCAYYFSGATLTQIGLMLADDGGGGGVSLFNGFVFFTYIIVWGTIGVLLDR